MVVQLLEEVLQVKQVDQALRKKYRKEEIFTIRCSAASQKERFDSD